MNRLDVLGCSAVTVQGARQQIGQEHGVTGDSTSTASSQLNQRSAPTRSSGTAKYPPRSSTCSVRRHCSCRKRTWMLSAACIPSMGWLVCMSRRQFMDRCESSPIPAISAPSGPNTPNCHRTWFLREVARYGYSK